MVAGELLTPRARQDFGARSGAQKRQGILAALELRLERCGSNSLLMASRCVGENDPRPGRRGRPFSVLFAVSKAWTASWH